MHRIIYLLLRTCFFSVCVFGVSGLLFAQHPDTPLPHGIHRATFPVSSGDTIFILPHQFIIKGSEKIFLDTIPLQWEKEYSLDSRFGIIRLLFNMPAYIKDSSRHHTLYAQYQSLPFTFQPGYAHREQMVKLDSLSGEKISIAKPSANFSLDDLFGSNLQKSGSLVRGFSVGTNRDLSLNSGLRMQMSGNLTNDIQVIAALTDENSPIQPEGTTQTLQEIDKVFVELRGNTMSATLGDFNLHLEGNEFGRLDRKLQGAKGSVLFGERTSRADLLISGAVTRGKFTTNQFPGIDGVQGPYRLTGQNNERAIIIIAGTERVYINGELMKRGELNDYVIDYAIAEVRFTSHRLISAASRISVDFEYSDRQFQRSLLGGKAGGSFFDNKLTFHTTIIREADDENSPVDASLSDEDKDTLRLAGNDQSKAVRSGVINVGPGKGQYVAIDTLYRTGAGDTVRTTFYRFDPTDSLGRAVYSVTFSYVGPGNGDYAKISSDEFQFAGLRQGSYLPKRFLPMPQSTMLADMDIAAQLSDDVTLSGEFAHSSFNANKFSTMSEDGSALKFGLQFTPKNVHFGATNIGGFDIRLNERYIGKHYVSLDRFNEVEFNRSWNVNDSTKGDEEIREGSMVYQPGQAVRLTGTIGSLTRGDLFSSRRYTGSVDLRNQNIPDLIYSFEVIKSSFSPDMIEGSWTRHHAILYDTLGTFFPSVRYDGEVLRNSSDGLLRSGSFRYHEIAPSLSWNPSQAITLTSQIGARWEDSLSAGALTRASVTTMQQYGVQLQEWNSVSTSLDVAIRDRKFTDLFRQRNLDNIRTILIRSQTRFTAINRGIETDLYYEAASERSAKLERVFQRVPKGTGNYVYIGDVNNNHISDPEDFQLSRFDGDYIALAIPTDELVPVINVKASTRFRTTGSRVFPGSSILEKVLSSFSGETYMRVEERSTEEDTKQIYLLHFSRYLNDRTTLLGTNIFTQDLYFLENNPGISLRFRYNQRRGLTQFAFQNERTYQREQSVRLRWQLIKEFTNQVDISRKSDLLSSSLLSNRVRGIFATSFVTDWTYRPEQHIELGFKLGFGDASNFDTTTVSLNDQSVRFQYAIAERAQMRIEMVREEVTLETREAQLPFELTNGKVLGKTWLLQIGMDYRISQVVQASLSYDGRSERGRGIVHTAKAEVRAFF
jgi:hypothetical protein